MFENRPGNAASNDDATAELFGDEGHQPQLIFGRCARNISEVAENVTVITREDIVRLQARNLDELLQYYTGVLPYLNRLPGDLSTPMVQGLPYQSTLVTIDGIPVNSMSAGMTDTSLVGLSMVERVEIVKGPASSVWGRSVGAVINVVTTDPEETRKATGGLRGYGGSNETEGFEGELGGTVGSTGYLIAGQHDQSNGFQPASNINQNGYYGKLKQRIGSDADISFLYASSHARRDLFASQELGLKQTGTPIDAGYYALRFHAQPAARRDIDATLYHYEFSLKEKYSLFPAPVDIEALRHGIDEKSNGLQLSYSTREGNYWLTAGFDGVFASSRITSISQIPVPLDMSQNHHPTQLGTYLSGGWRLYDPLTLTASARYDHNTTTQDTFSPNLGLIYKVDDATVVRASASYGYSLPILSGSDMQLARLWRVQIGTETNRIPGLWWKTNLFYDRARGIKLHLFPFDLWPTQDQNLIRQGVETEVKTVPVLNTTFSAGYTFLDIYDWDTGKIVQGLPRHHLLLSADYRYQGTDALLIGRYVFWNYPGCKDAVVCDLLLTQRLRSWDTGSVSLQFGAHNIFNGAQYPTPFFANQPRWFEGGLRMEF